MDSKQSQIGELLTAKLSASDPEWMERGACVNSPFDPFDKEEGELVAMLCPGCPVRPQCDAYRQEKGVSAGVWAGIDAAQGSGEGE